MFYYLSTFLPPSPLFFHRTFNTYLPTLPPSLHAPFVTICPPFVTFTSTLIIPHPSFSTPSLPSLLTLISN